MSAGPRPVETVMDAAAQLGESSGADVVIPTRPADPGGHRVLVLAPSSGRGGGIEGYMAAVVEALQEGHSSVRVVSANRSGRLSARRKMGFALEALRAVRHHRPDVLLCLHLGLLPLAVTCRHLAGRETSLNLVCHGREIWGMSELQAVLLRYTQPRLLAVSDFSAGSVVRFRPAAVLSPGLTRDRFSCFHDAGTRRPGRSGQSFRIVSVFRLADFAAKGGPELLAAVAHLRGGGVDAELTLAGVSVGAPPVLTGTGRPAWLTVLGDPTDEELARLLGSSDVFVLASRLHAKAPNHGEGFGLVLVEAALAGLPVVTPWGGGSHAAFVEGVTGLRPRDDSASALADTLAFLARHPSEAARLGHNGHYWAASRFSPSCYRAQVEAVILGRPSGGRQALDIDIRPAPPVDGTAGPGREALGTETPP